MPASRQRSRSPCLAFAFSATIGVRCSGGSSERILRAASKPSVSDIWQSISTRSKVRVLQIQHLDAVLGDRHLTAQALEEPRSDEVVHAVVLGDQHPRLEAGAVFSPRHVRGPGRLAQERAPRTRPELAESPDRGEQGRLPHRRGEERRRRNGEVGVD